MTRWRRVVLALSVALITVVAAATAASAGIQGSGIV